MNKHEILTQAAEIRADLVGADDATRQIIFAELHALDKLAQALGFSIMMTLTSNWVAR